MPIDVEFKRNRLADGDFYYWNGNESTDGSWRTGVVNGKRLLQYRKSGTWITVNTDSYT